MDINERIIAKTKELGMSQVELAKRTNLTKGAVNQWFKGVSAPNGENPLKTAAALGVSPEWLQFGKDNDGAHISLVGTKVVAWENEDDLAEHGEYVFIPRFDIHVSAGTGSIVWDECQKDQAQAYRLAFMQMSGLKPASLRVIYARGDSMEPRIFDGDSLLIDITQTNVIDGKTYVIRIGDEVFVKVLRKLPLGELMVISHNPDYPPKNYTHEQVHDNISVVGRVVQVSSMGGL